MSDAAVAVRDLFRVYATPDGTSAALQGLTLDVAEGEVVVVFGPSGSGKSTLLRILAALDIPSAGSAHAFGLDLTAAGRRARARYRSRVLGYVDQHYTRALAPELPARELVATQLRLLGTPARAALGRADALLERVGLVEHRGARAAELSGGEQQRVALCAALAHRPRLLLADEPTGELDERAAASVYALLAELAREQGTTAVVVSHDPRAATMADRVVGVRDGRISDEGAAGTAAIVVGRGGWVRLPEELLVGAGIRSRARARLVDHEIVVSSADEQDAAPATAPAGHGDRPETLHPRDGGVGAEIRGVTRTYGSGARTVTPFRELTATFRRGQVTAVTGPSGSGKTTLLRLLAALDSPTAGEIVVAGTRVAHLDRERRAELRRSHVAVVEQQPRLVPFLTARENVELALALRGAKARDARTRAEEALAAVALSDRAGHSVEVLSAGERQRVALARAVAPRPSVLLADEPTARLDLGNAVAVAALLARLARDEGEAIVCATHDPRVVDQADAEISLAMGCE